MTPFLDPARIQLTESEAAHELAQQLEEYRKLREHEKSLRARVEFMRKQAALQGPLRVEVDLALTLEDERTLLEQAQEQLREREGTLERLEFLPKEKRFDLAVDEVERLVSEIKARREQIRIHQDNVNFVEEQKAKLGAEGRLDWENELKLVREDLARVRKELDALKHKLGEKWGIDPDSIEGLEEMGATALRDFASKAALKAQSAKRKQAESRIMCVAEKYDEMVVEVLKELGGAAYPGYQCNVPKTYAARIADDSTRRRVTLGDAVWNLSFVGSFGGVSITLPLDSDGEPRRFECQVSRPSDGRLSGNAAADLSREALVGALRQLHTKHRAWWQVWYKPPNFPESWRI